MSISRARGGVDTPFASGTLRRNFGSIWAKIQRANPSIRPGDQRGHGYIPHSLLMRRSRGMGFDPPKVSWTGPVRCHFHVGSQRVVVRSSLSGKGVGVRTCVATADVDGVAGDVGAVGACGIELAFSEPRFNFAVARFEPCCEVLGAGLH
jgi:hypothetical protein